MKEEFGQQIFITGDKFKGYFKNELRCGFGELTYANGDKYEGNFSNDLKNE